jgi:hypothetical protein
MAGLIVDGISGFVRPIPHWPDRLARLELEVHLEREFDLAPRVGSVQ